MKYKLIVADLDGTLLDDRQAIGGETRRLIDEFRARGGHFSLATGRMEDSCRKYVEELAITGPVILYNGAKVVDLRQDREYFAASLDLETARVAVAALRAYPWDVLVYKDGKILVRELTPTLAEYARKDGVPWQVVGDLDAILDRPPTKILIIGDDSEGKFAEFAAACGASLGRPLNTVRSEVNYLEILPPGASKGAALAEMVRIIGVSLQETVAIGDHLNDLVMVEMAGKGVAVANAHPDLKRRADYVTRATDTAGVAEVIRLVLSEAWE